MADILDVENCLVATVAAALYPNGTGNPSISGTPIVIYAGWPDSDGLTADLAAGKTHVTVFPKDQERNTTRYSTAQQVVTPAAPALTLTVSEQVVTVGGTVSTPQNVGLIIDGLPYTYAVQSGDTLDSIAASLEALVAAAISGCSVTGPAITVGPTGRIEAARVGASGTVAAEFRRQERVITITVWANAPALRDQIAAALDVALAQLERITLPDGFGGRLIYRGTMVVDGMQKEALYRRDVNYLVEYPTTVASPAYQVITDQLNLTGGEDPTAPALGTSYS